MMRTWWPFALCACLVVGVQVAVTATGKEFYLTQLIMSAYYSLVVVGLCLLMGYAGQISLGHAAFFAIGGYTAAVMTTLNLVSVKDAPGVVALKTVGLVIDGTNSWGARVMHLSPWLSLIAAVALSAGVAYLIGMPVLRLKGHYLAMATLGFGTIIHRVVLGTKLFGSADGISDVPGFRIVGPLVLDGSQANRVGSYYFTFCVVLLCVLLVRNLIHSRAGRALRALHGNEAAAQAMGVDTTRYKLHLFVLSAVFAAMAGVFLTHYNGGIGPSEAGVMKSVRYVAIVAVGGMANLWGALIAGVVLNFLSLRGYFGTYDDAVFGGVLIIMMLFAPEGILRTRLGAKKRPDAAARPGAKPIQSANTGASAKEAPHAAP